MQLTTKVNGFALAAAAAVMFLGAPMANADDSAAASVGHCVGANSCKGQSSCKSASNSCKGQNSCKGKGFTATTKDDCAKAGGKFEAAK